MPAVPAQQKMQKPPSGIVNPLYKHADFGSQNPPYQGSWVPAAPSTAGHYMTHAAGPGHGHGSGTQDLYRYGGPIAAL